MTKRTVFCLPLFHCRCLPSPLLIFTQLLFWHHHLLLSWNQYVLSTDLLNFLKGYLASAYRNTITYKAVHVHIHLLDDTIVTEISHMLSFFLFYRALVDMCETTIISDILTAFALMEISVMGALAILVVDTLEA